MENLCRQFSECRKVTMQKCFKHSHTLMLKRNLGWVRGKTEPTENLENWTNRKFMSLVFWLSTEYQHWPLSKNLKVAAILLTSIIWKNFKLLTPLKFGSPVFQVSIETQYQHWPLWKNWKMAAISLILIIQKYFKWPIPPKFGSPVSKCQWKRNISIGHCKKIEKWLPFR